MSPMPTGEPVLPPGDQTKADYRAELVSIRNSEINTFSTQLFAVSSGALAITWTFMTDIVGKDSVVSAQYLHWAWVLWIFSAASMLFSHLIGFHASDTAISKLSADASVRGNPSGKLSTLIHILNWASWLAFLAGLILAMYWGALNLDTA